MPPELATPHPTHPCLSLLSAFAMRRGGIESKLQKPNSTNAGAQFGINNEAQSTDVRTAAGRQSGCASRLTDWLANWLAGCLPAQAGEGAY